MKGWLQRARLSASDRISVTFFASLALHAFVIFGIGFVWVPPERNRTPPMLEVTLTEKPQEEAPEDHDFLAAENQDGGGKSQQPDKPQQQQPRTSTASNQGEQAVDAGPRTSQTNPAEREPQITGNQEDETAPQDPEPQPEAELSPSKVIDDTRRVASEQALQRAREAVDARYPSKRHIRARTKSHAAAEYMRQWVNKVEEVGNLNYPEEARDRNLTGRLILEVTVRPDGSVREIKTLRTSEHPALDQAAERIVDLAGPFAEVPKKVLEGDDLLVITRTWEFDNRLDTSGAR
jgi:protein TonB